MNSAPRATAAVTDEIADELRTNLAARNASCPHSCASVFVRYFAVCHPVAVHSIGVMIDDWSTGDQLRKAVGAWTERMAQINVLCDAVVLQTAPAPWLPVVAT